MFGVFRGSLILGDIRELSSNAKDPGKCCQDEKVGGCQAKRVEEEKVDRFEKRTNSTR